MRALLEAMPKVELHLHLEGAIPLDAMWQLIERNGGDAEVPNPEALADKYRFTDFSHFIDTWVWKLRFHRSYDDYTFMAEAVAGDLARQNIVRAEAYFSPTDVRDHGLEPGPLAVAVRRGLDRVPTVSVGLIPDLVRDTGPVMAARTLDALLEVREEAGIVGVTIGGSEQSFPPEPFEAVYRSARRAGLQLTAHAGEAAGPSSVRGAIDVLGVDRIGHGIRLVEDPALLDRVVETQIPLEVCPTSNLRTGVVASWDHHPVRTLIDAGANVTISTDDPAMFDCTLAGEYQALHEHLGYPRSTLVRLAQNAIGAAWIDQETRSALSDQLNRWQGDRG